MKSASARRGGRTIITRSCARARALAGPGPQPRARSPSLTTNAGGPNRGSSQRLYLGCSRKSLVCVAMLTVSRARAEGGSRNVRDDNLTCERSLSVTVYRTVYRALG